MPHPTRHNATITNIHERKGRRQRVQQCACDARLLSPQRTLSTYSTVMYTVTLGPIMLPQYFIIVTVNDTDRWTPV